MAVLLILIVLLFSTITHNIILVTVTFTIMNMAMIIIINTTSMNSTVKNPPQNFLTFPDETDLPARLVTFLVRDLKKITKRLGTTASYSEAFFFLCCLACWPACLRPIQKIVWGLGFICNLKTP